jgi:hypothetical protein
MHATGVAWSHVRHTFERSEWDWGAVASGLKGDLCAPLGHSRSHPAFTHRCHGAMFHVG